MVRHEIERIFPFDDIEEDDDELKFIHNDIECVLDKKNGNVSVYKLFMHEDDNISVDDYLEAVATENRDICEAFEAEESYYYEEKAFYEFSKLNGRYNIEMWDFCYGYPGGTDIFVGYNDCNSNKLIDFVKMNDAFENEISKHENIHYFLIEMFKKSHEDKICQKLNLKLDPQIYSDEYAIDKYHIGVHYCLILKDNVMYYSDRKNVMLGLEYINEYEYIYNEKIFLIHGKLIISNARASITLNTDKIHNNLEAIVEEHFMIDTIRNFIPFASDNYKNMISNYKDIELDKEFSIRTDIDAYITTEGSTDWKHLKTAWRKIIEDKKYLEEFQNIKLQFKEYEPKNSGVECKDKIQMDGGKLSYFCEAYSCEKNKTLRIYIADRDVNNDIKSLSEDDGKKVKVWGNRVYSFVLPIPKHRAKLKKICIEHFYTDSELKTFKKNKDGILRRGLSTLC